jgi:Holliday junction resolvase
MRICLTLYEEEGINGIEFPVGGRFIDILAVDSDGALVVIELKVSRGYDLIVARQISEDLLLACSLLADVQLFEYELSLALKQVDTHSGK